MKIIILIILSLTMSSFTFAQASLFNFNKVKEIKLLESNRDDVTKILESDSLSVSDFSHYQWFYRENEMIRVSYSNGKCSENSEEINASGDWNVPEWKVTEIVITPKDLIQIKDVGIDYSKFRKEKEKLYDNRKKAYAYHSKDLGIAIEVYGDRVETIYFIPPNKDYLLLCNKEEVKKYYFGKSWFRESGIKGAILDSNHPANVTNLVLSATEVTAECNSLNAAQNKNCLDGDKKVAVSTTGIDPENDVLTYFYKVSGGKIIGQGAKVIWDLSGVKAGTYTITAAVNDGCGLCGKYITKTVTIR